MAVNDAILQLSGYRLPDLVQTVFARSADFDDLRRQSRERHAQDADAAARERLRLRRRLPGRRGEHARSRELSSARLLRHRRSRCRRSRDRADSDARRPDDVARDGRRGRHRRRALRHQRRDVRRDQALDRSIRCCRSSRAPATGSTWASRCLARSDRRERRARLVANLSGALAFASGDPTSMRTDESPPSGTHGRLSLPRRRSGRRRRRRYRSPRMAGAIADAFKVPFEVRDRATTESVIETGATTSHADDSART